MKGARLDLDPPRDMFPEGVDKKCLGRQIEQVTKQYQKALDSFRMRLAFASAIKDDACLMERKTKVVESAILLQGLQQLAISETHYTILQASDFAAHLPTSHLQTWDRQLQGIEEEIKDDHEVVQQLCAAVIAAKAAIRTEPEGLNELREQIGRTTPVPESKAAIEQLWEQVMPEPLQTSSRPLDGLTRNRPRPTGRRRPNRARRRYGKRTESGSHQTKPSEGCNLGNLLIGTAAGLMAIGFLMAARQRLGRNQLGGIRTIPNAA